MPSGSQTLIETARPSDSGAAAQASVYRIPWPLAGDVVNQAAVEIGLSPVSDPYTSTDANFVQMRYLLNSLGKQMVHSHHWSHLRKEWAFTTEQNRSIYPYPPDFHNMIDQTGWNKTTRLPVGGPLSPQEWTYLSSRVVNVVFNILFRPAQRVIELYPPGTTPAGYNITYTYISKNFVSTVANPLDNTAEKATSSDDNLWFDELMLVRGLKLYFLRAKGFDTTAVQQEFDETLELVKGHDTPAAIISLNKGMIQRLDRPIGDQSTPITGFGM